MISLLLAILVASFLGSLHCVGMCGVFAAIAGSGGDRGPSLIAFYNLGRLAVYLSMGAIAGVLGTMVDGSGAWAGVQHASSVLFGSLLISGGIAGFAKELGWRLPALTLSSPRLQKWAARLPPARRAAALGVVTALLPCGWLWAFVISAGATGSPVRGTLVMLTFWIGGLPALVFAGAGARRLLASVGPRVPWAPLMMLLAGLFSLRVMPEIVRGSTCCETHVTQERDLR